MYWNIVARQDTHVDLCWNFKLSFFLSVFVSYKKTISLLLSNEVVTFPALNSILKVLLNGNQFVSLWSLITCLESISTQTQITLNTVMKNQYLILMTSALIKRCSAFYFILIWAFYSAFFPTKCFYVRSIFMCIIA